MKTLNQHRNRIRVLCKNFPSEDVEMVCMRLALPELQFLLEQMNNIPEDKLKQVFYQQVFRDL